MSVITNGNDVNNSNAVVPVTPAQDQPSADELMAAAFLVLAVAFLAETMDKSGSTDSDSSATPATDPTAPSAPTDSSSAAPADSASPQTGAAPVATDDSSTSSEQLEEEIEDELMQYIENLLNQQQGSASTSDPPANLPVKSTSVAA